MRCKIIWSLWASPCQLSKSSSHFFLIHFHPFFLPLHAHLCVFHNKSFLLPSCRRCRLISGKSLSRHLCCTESTRHLFFFLPPSAFWYRNQAARRLFHGEFTDRNHSAYSLVLVIGGRWVAIWRFVTKMFCESWRGKKKKSNPNVRNRAKSTGERRQRSYHIYSSKPLSSNEQTVDGVRWRRKANEDSFSVFLIW